MASLDTRSTIAGYFPTHAAAEAAVSELKQAGFSSSQIGYAGRGSRPAPLDAATLPRDDGFRDPATGEPLQASSLTTEHEAHESAWTKIKRFFEGGDEPYNERDRDLSAHHLTPGTGMTSSFGTGLETGPVTDSDRYMAEDLQGSFTKLAIPEEHSRYFGHRLGQGDEGVVVTVNAESRAAEAEEILARNGGDLGADAATYRYDTPNTVAAADTAAAATTDRTVTIDPQSPQHVDLLGEILRVHKDRIQSGEVRVRKEIYTEQVPVTRERVVVETVAPELANAVSPTADTAIPVDTVPAATAFTESPSDPVPDVTTRAFRDAELPDSPAPVRSVSDPFPGNALSDERAVPVAGGTFLGQPMTPNSVEAARDLGNNDLGTRDESFPTKDRL